VPGGKTDTYENTALDAVFGSGTPTNIHVALHTGDPGANGATGEASYTGYARKQVTNNATNFPAASSGQKNLATQQDFAAAGSGITPVRAIAWSAWDSTSGGVCFYVGFLVDFGVWALADPTANNFTKRAHGFSNNQQVRAFSIEGLADDPGGLTMITQIYHVVNQATDTFQLSLTSGGSAIDITSMGYAEICLDRSKEIGPSDVPRFLANQLIIREA
jgi:hypothetical protein